ncbi:MAG: Gfo/Idh/MocA family oxidoreductase [Verrucomicrobiota bacterium]
MPRPLSRRHFLGASTAGAFWIVRQSFARISPNEKLNLGVIGVGGRGGENLKEVSGENIVALCDVDDNTLAAAAKLHPGAKTYNDFQKLIAQNDIDAIVIGTPDHVHAVQAMAALQSGRHVYCEKPLTRTISEARAVTELARKKKLITQIGTQIHAGNNYRRVVELVQSGVIGAVREVHVWVTATYGGMDLPKTYPPAPPHLHYDLWLGPVPERPYSPEWVPFKWRHWWAFGGGSLADFGCHFMDLPHWALGLSQPLSAEVIDGPPVHAESTPLWLMVSYQYPARGEKPPVHLTWYHGGKQPPPAILPESYAMKWKSGVLFIGDKGQVLSDYGKHLLLPEKQFEGFKRPEPFLANSIGHHKEWIKAVKTGGVTTCHFDYSGPLTEAALLGNVAYRTGKKIEWDARNLKARNCPEAERYIQHEYRKGWKL